MTVTTGAARPKPRTGTGMVYRTSSGSNMRAPMILSGTSSVVSNASVSGAGGGGGVGGSTGRSTGLVGAIALCFHLLFSMPITNFNLSLIFLIVCHYPKRSLDVRTLMHTYTHLLFSFFLFFSSFLFFVTGSWFRV